MYRLFKPFSIALSFLLFASPSFATTWYVVSGTGNDSNDGKSLGTPFLTLNHAVSVTAPGDTVYCIGTFGGGTSGSDPFTINVPGSAAGGYITYASYYQGTTGTPCLINSTQSYNTVHVTPSSTANISYISLVGLEIAGPNGSGSLAGAWTNASSTTWLNAGIYNAGGIIIDNGSTPTAQTASGTNASGQKVINTSTNPVSGGVLAGDFVYDTTHPASTLTGSSIVASTTSSSITLVNNLSGVVSNGDSLTVVHVPHHIQVLNNYVHDFAENGIQASYGDYMTVSGNTSVNNGWYSPFATSGISIAFARDIDTTTGYKTIASGNLLAGNKNFIGNHYNGPTISTSSGTSAGSNVLHFSSTTNVGNGFLVYNTHSGNSGSILPGTQVQSFTGTTVTLTNNVQTGSGSGVGSGDAIAFNAVTDGEGIIIDDNNGDQQGMPHYGGATLISNNVGYNNGSSAFLAFDSWNVDILYNTAYLNQQYQTFPGGDINNNLAVNGHIENNVIQASASYPVLQDQQTSGMTIAYNLGYGGNGTFAGTNNVVGNPLFVAPSITAPVWSYNPSTTAFQLQPGSPAIDAANGSYPRTGTDFLGNPGLVGTYYDMGAYESFCSTYQTSTIRTIPYLLTSEFQDGQTAGSITPVRVRDAISTLACGRSPYAH